MKTNKLFTQLFVSAMILIVLASPARNYLGRNISNLTKSSSIVISGLGRNITNSFSSIKEISELRQENRELAQKIESLEVDRSKIAELEYENSLLQNELSFQQKSEKDQLIPARIIGREPASFLDYITIDKGSNDGVATKLPAVSNGVLIGQVGEVYENESKIVLITSKDSIIQAMLQKSRSKGVLRGGISGLVLANITADTEYNEGDYIITSGLGGELQEGLLVGKAKGLKPGSSGILKNIGVDPIADFSKLEIVFVLKEAK